MSAVFGLQTLSLPGQILSRSGARLVAGTVGRRLMAPRAFRAPAASVGAPETTKRFIARARLAGRYAEPTKSSRACALTVAEALPRPIPVMTSSKSWVGR